MAEALVELHLQGVVGGIGVVAHQVHVGELRIGDEEVLRQSGAAQQAAIHVGAGAVVLRLFANVPTLPFAR